MAETNQNEISPKFGDKKLKKRCLIMDNESVPTKKMKNSISFPSNISFQSLYLNEEDADVHFTFESSDERIAAHKNILALLSPVFDAIFYGLAKVESEVKIKEACVDSFKQFLQFFYLKEVVLSIEHIESVMTLCHKYEIDECLQFCSSFLMENLSIEELCFGYQLAMRYDLNDLKEFCKHEVSMNTEEILKTNGFLRCDWNVLNEIVENDKLNCREVVLLEACTFWARVSCEREGVNPNDNQNIRNQLKDVIYKIRFNRMSICEFLQYLNNWRPYGPYNYDEVADIRSITTKATLTSTKFNRSNRLFDSTPWNQSQRFICIRFGVDDGDYYIPSIVTTIFSSDRLLSLSEFNMYFKPYDEDFRCNITLKRWDTENEEKMIDNFYVESQQRFVSSIKLIKPIVIEKNIKYKIKLDFSTSGIQLRSCGKMKRTVQLENGATIRFHHDSSSEFNSVEKGVITWMYFREING